MSEKDSIEFKRYCVTKFHSDNKTICHEAMRLDGYKQCPLCPMELILIK